METHDEVHCVSDKQPQTKGRIEVRNLSVQFGNTKNGVEAVRDLTFAVEPGEFLCLLGSSGCGKSTILNVLAGFFAPSQGSALLDDKEITQPGPDRAMVFQRHALFPWKTVRQNVEFGLKMAGLPTAQCHQRAQEYINMVGLQGAETRYPCELSGGMEQRVGLARVLAVNPAVLLMDEPFGSLDAQTRIMMQELFLRIWDEAGKTVVFVTHDVEEAILLADRILVLTARPGRIKEEIVVGLGRPRTYAMTLEPKFIQTKQRALELIREESLKAINFSQSQLQSRSSDAH